MKAEMQPVIKLDSYKEHDSQNQRYIKRTFIVIFILHLLVEKFI